MKPKIVFDVPVYMNVTKKKLSLVGLNLYRNMHYRTNNFLKKRYKDYVTSLGIKEKVSSKYYVHYTYYYKNKLSDTPNVCAVIDKYVLDALQELGVVVQDNIGYLEYVKYITGTQDRVNPRVTVEIYEVEHNE